MEVILIQSSGFVTQYFGPFTSKEEAKEWARQLDITNYSLTVMIQPDIMLPRQSSTGTTATSPRRSGGEVGPRMQ